jgi:predicted hydrolase (HD superfamily)
MIPRQTALEILNEHLPNKNLLKHCIAVEAAMRGLYKHLVPAEKQNAEDEERWARAGLMHDGDCEETRGNFDLHTKKVIEWMKEKGETDEAVFQAILAHNYNHNQSNPPSNDMEWSLYICDELTGFIIAVALILPDKKLAPVTVDSVLKKFPSKNFAAGVHRPQIQLCEEKLNIPLPDFVKIVLDSMQKISTDLGL